MTKLKVTIRMNKSYLALIIYMLHGEDNRGRMSLTCDAYTWYEICNIGGISRNVFDLYLFLMDLYLVLFNL